MEAVLATAVCFVIAFIAAWILRWAYKLRHAQTLFERYGIPGPPPDFPDGNFAQSRRFKTINEAIDVWLEKYGPIFGFYNNKVPFLVIKDLDILKQIMIKDFKQFPERMEFIVDFEPMNDSLVCLGGQRWKEVRSVLSPLFSSSKIKLMSTIMNEKTSIAVDVVRKHAEENDMFDLMEVLQRLNLDIISDCALAMDVDSQREKNHPYLKEVKKFFPNDFGIILDIAFKIPIIFFITNMIFKLTGGQKMIDTTVSHLKKVVKHRRANPHMRRQDFLQIVLDSADSKITDGEIIGNLFIFLFAGYETTSSALAFAFWLLVQHQDIQDKLYNEIVEKCDSEELTYDQVHSMVYLDQVFAESMRMYPSVSVFISRRSEEDYPIDKYTIPKGATVIAPIWSIQHDPELWPDPWQFDPERFAPENKSQIRNLSYFPFGIGPRNCIGMRFAQLESKITIARLIRHFKFVPCEKTEKTLTLASPGGTIKPANGVYVKAIPRKKPF